MSQVIEQIEQSAQAPEILLYPRIRKSPFFYASRRHGVRKYSVYNHHYHPRVYTDPVDEYWALVQGVTLWDVGVERQIEIAGPDAFEFTQRLVPRNMEKCKVGQCKYVFVTAPDGGIINDPVLLRVEENRFWLSLADSDVLLWCQGLAHNSGLDVTIREVDVAPVQVQGPKAKQVMVDLFGESVLEIPYYYLMEAEIDGMSVVISRTGYSGEIGYEIYLRDASLYGEQLWQRVFEAGRPHGMQVIGPCHIRRIEGAILAFGCDIWYDTNPFEVGMGYNWMVDLRGDDDFIGRAALERIKAEGVSRKLVGVEIDGPNIGYFTDGSMIDVFPVYGSDGERIGKVTSATHSPRLEKNIGYAMVPTAYTELGTALRIEANTGMQDAVVVPKPFHDPNKETPKG
ncbi:glycine cleavage system protein T [Arhodomonas aquaeolei]|uniref:glycine cleavage T C-terminal barrel domain-containing protein n=1 Tax=Arhodomonas aquaeolei TaxID=2369 RepID=UPI00036BDCB2|nr:glycine cleavage T C-terminal barrel domain-containing protein [Arhodomonas aquaeolei]MCS4505391.1 glycine cleavage system protein T [Arhodomonas aquaeolei]